MHYLQSTRFKIFYPLILLFSWSHLSIANGEYDDVLKQADSLFSNQRYTQAYHLYDSIYTYGQTSSPKMLLRMAYIQEGLGDYTLALYHLNEIYIRTSDERILQKMENLANDHDLVGYNYSDSEFFMSVYHEHYDQIVLGLVLLSLLFLAGIIYQKVKLKERPLTNFILLSLSALALIWILNVGMGYKEAIIIHPNTYIMSRPSSSSEVLAIVSKGNKIPVRKKYDVWLKTEWQNKPAYVKRKNVTPVDSW